MKSVNWVILLIVLYSLSSAIAGNIPLPVTLSDLDPAIESNYSVGSTYQIIYTITNLLPQDLEFTVSGLSEPVSRVTVDDDCGDVLPALSSCNIGVLIAPIAENAGEIFNQTLTLRSGRLKLTSPIDFSVPVPASSVIAIAGQMIDLPLLLQSHNEGTNWSQVSIANLGISAGAFSGINCSQNEPNIICSAVGQNSGNNQPLLVVTTDGGSGWSLPSISGLANAGTILYSSSCTGSGTSVLCVAVGDLNTSSGNQASYALFPVSQDGGAHWDLKSQEEESNRTFQTVSCVGNNASNTLCVAGGQVLLNSAPVLSISVDRGDTWISPSITDLPTTGSFLGSSCTGTGSHAVCTAVGNQTLAPIQNDLSIRPKISLSVDGGSSWTTPSITNLPSTGSLSGVNCIQDASSATICTAVGYDNKGYPLLVQGNVSTETWERKDLSILQFEGSLSSVAGNIGSSTQP